MVSVLGVEPTYNEPGHKTYLLEDAIRITEILGEVLLLLSSRKLEVMGLKSPLNTLRYHVLDGPVYLTL